MHQSLLGWLSKPKLRNGIFVGDTQPERLSTSPSPKTQQRIESATSTPHALATAETSADTVAPMRLALPRNPGPSVGRYFTRDKVALPSYFDPVGSSACASPSSLSSVTVRSNLNFIPSEDFTSKLNLFPSRLTF